IEVPKSRRMWSWTRKRSRSSATADLYALMPSNTLAPRSSASALTCMRLSSQGVIRPFIHVFSGFTCIPPCSRGRCHGSQLAALLVRVLDRGSGATNLDLLVAADAVGHVRQLHRQVVIGRRQLADDLFDETLIPRDQLPFQASDRRAA